MKSILFIGAATAALIAQSGPSLAQDASVTDEIVVIGTRAQNAKIIEEKRDTSGIADFLSQDEIGRLPDLNIAESLRRIPGVTSIFDEDRGRFVVVRGLNPNLNYVTIDGLGVATTDSFGGTGRRVNLEVIPSSAVSTLEVRKTFTPEIDGGAIGGYVNLRTRSAYDADGTYFVIDGGLNYFTFQDVPDLVNYAGDLSGGLGGQAEATYSQTFGANDQFGVVFAGHFLQTKRDELKDIQADERYYDATGARVDPILADGSVNPVWNGFTAPEEVRRYTYTNRVRNWGLSGKAEYQPSETFYASIFGYYFAEGQQETRQTVQLQSLDGISNQTATSGDMNIGRVQIGWNRNPLDRQNYGAIFSADWTPAERHVVSVRSGWSYNDFEDFSPVIDYRGLPANPAISYTVEETDPRVFGYNVADVAGLNDPSNYGLAVYFENSRFSREDVYDTKIDYAFNRSLDDYGFGIQIGGEFRRIDRERDNARTIFETDGSPLTQFAVQTDYQPGYINFPLLWVDGPAFVDTYASTLPIDVAATADRAVREDFQYVEDTFAGYGLVSYRTERFEIIGGLRYEDVSTEATAPGTLVSDPFVTREGGYDKLLPSVVASYNLTDDLRLKAAFSQSVGRANPGDAAQRESVDLVNNTIRRGNPDIQPRESDNFDVALEYFFPGGDGLFSVAFFHKNISNEIFTLTEVENIGGVDFDVTTPRNAEGADLTGVEVGLIKNTFDFLPAPFDGFGFNGNFTYVDGEIAFINAAGDFETSDRLVEQSRWSGNASLFYNWNNVFETRLSYNYWGKYIDSLASRPWQARGWDAFETLDLSMRYNISDNFLLKFEGRNLLNNNRDRIRGLDLVNLHEEVEFGQSFFAGFAYSY